MTINMAAPYCYLALVIALIVGALIGHLATAHGDTTRTETRDNG